MFSFDLNIFQVDTEYISSQHWIYFKSTLNINQVTLNIFQINTGYISSRHWIYQFNTEWKTSQKEYISSQKYFKSTPKIVETEAQSIPLRISTKPHVIIYIFIRTFTFVRWLIKAMREKNIILFPQYNILIPQLINMFPQERHFFSPQHTILLPQHIILFPQYIILFPQHIILLPQYIILFPQHLILFHQYIILFPIQDGHQRGT